MTCDTIAVGEDQQPIYGQECGIGLLLKKFSQAAKKT
jgi:hypothetical protein